MNKEVVRSDRVAYLRLSMALDLVKKICIDRLNFSLEK